MDRGRYNDEPTFTSDINPGSKFGGRVCHLSVWCGEEKVLTISAGVGVNGAGNVPT
jgi:hypothetical protein